MSPRRGYTVLVDYENAAEKWWDAARAASATAPVCVRLMLEPGGPHDVIVSKREGEAVLAWAMGLPGWDDGPDFARHPLLLQRYEA